MIINPYAGVDSVKFGMLKSEVEKEWGPANKRETGFLGEEIEYRRENGLLATYSKQSKSLVEIGFNNNIDNLEYRKIFLFRHPRDDVINQLLIMDGTPFEYVGFLLFFKLGISLSGFLTDEGDDTSVTIFQRGRWDDVFSDMAPYTRPG